MPFILTAAPETEPVTLAEAKAHLRIDGTDDDTYVGALITVARQHAEQVTRRALMPQSWELVLDAFPTSREIELAMGHLDAESVAVTYLDAAGAEQTLDAAAYQVDAVREPGRLVLAPGQAWPVTEAGRVGAVRVAFDVGYADAAAVPQAIKAAMLLLIGHLYEHRESEITGIVTTPLRFAIDALLGPYRLQLGFH